MMSRVSNRTKASARMLKEMVMPSSSVMRLAREVCAVSERLPSTPHSRSRLPNIRNPTRETDAGEIRPTRKVTIMGNRIRVVLVTGLEDLAGIRIRRSFFVVTRRMAKGCTIGTSAM